MSQDNLGKWEPECQTKDDGSGVATAATRRAKLQSNHLHQQTNNQLFTGRMPFLLPNQQCQSTEGKNITLHGLAYPKLTWGSSNFVSDH